MRYPPTLRENTAHFHLYHHGVTSDPEASVASHLYTSCAHGDSDGDPETNEQDCLRPEPPSLTADPVCLAQVTAHGSRPLRLCVCPIFCYCGDRQCVCLLVAPASRKSEASTESKLGGEPTPHNGQYPQDQGTSPPKRLFLDGPISSGAPAEWGQAHGRIGELRREAVRAPALSRSDKHLLNSAPSCSATLRERSQ